MAREIYWGNKLHELAELANLAAVYYSLGDYSQAETGYQGVLTLALEADAPEDDMTALAGLGLIYRALGR